MSAALTLLISALQLLTIVATTPNLPPEFKVSAENIARHAIQVAQDELNQATTTPIQVDIQTVTIPLPPPPQPTFGGIITPMPEPIDKSAIVITLSGGRPESETVPFGTYAIRVSVLDTNGKAIKLASVTLTVDGLIQEGTTNTQSIPDSADWRTTFEYIPDSFGPKTLTFTSGTLTKEYIVDVK